MLRTSFGRIRPGHPTTSYPGVAQLVARLLWEDRRSIHSPKSESPEVLGTVACGGNPPPEDPPAKPALTTALPTDTKNLLFPSPHSIMQKNRISGISAVGSAGGLGPSGREFESPISDQNPLKLSDFRGFFLFGWGNHRLCRWRSPVKSFSFKHRAKRTANNKLSVKKGFR